MYQEDEEEGKERNYTKEKNIKKEEEGKKRKKSKLDYRGPSQQCLYHSQV
jgi:hypothetical protein